MQSNENDTILLADIVRQVLEHEGVQFKSFVFLRWRVIDDRILPRPIQSVIDLLTEFTDGSYQLTLSEVRISHIEKEPFTVPEITIEVAYENGQWGEPRLYTDYEEFGPEHATPQALQARLEKIKDALKIVLPYVSLIVEIAKNVRALFFH